MDFAQPRRKEPFRQRGTDRSAHPKTVGFDPVADRLFAARQVVLIKERAHFGAAPLIDHPLDRIALLEQLFDLLFVFSFYVFLITD